MNKISAWMSALLALACGFAANAQQGYPNRPVRVIVFVPAGGGAADGPADGRDRVPGQADVAGLALVADPP